MFIRYFTYVRRDFDDVRRDLESGPQTWVPGLVHDAFETGDEVQARVGVGKHLRLTKDVNVQIGEPFGNGDHASLPLRIRAAGAGALFPQMEAQLQSARVGDGYTQLSFDASYKPPLGVGGVVIDAAVLHRVAEAMAKDFMDRIASRLEEVA